MQSWIKRPVLHLKNVIGGPHDVPGNRMPVGGTELQRAKDEHVERALQELDAIFRRLRPVSGPQHACTGDHPLRRLSSGEETSVTLSVMGPKLRLLASMIDLILFAGARPARS